MTDGSVQRPIHREARRNRQHLRCSCYAPSYNRRLMRNLYHQIRNTCSADTFKEKESSWEILERNWYLDKFTDVRGRSRLPDDPIQLAPRSLVSECYLHQPLIPFPRLDAVDVVSSYSSIYRSGANGFVLSNVVHWETSWCWLTVAAAECAAHLIYSKSLSTLPELSAGPDRRPTANLVCGLLWRPFRCGKNHIKTNGRFKLTYLNR